LSVIVLLPLALSRCFELWADGSRSNLFPLSLVKCVWWRLIFHISSPCAQIYAHYGNEVATCREAMHSALRELSHLSAAVRQGRCVSDTLPGQAEKFCLIGTRARSPSLLFVG
jgi:hypothetical protein